MSVDFPPRLLSKMYSETQNQISPQFLATAKCGCTFYFSTDHRGVWAMSGMHSPTCEKSANYSDNTVS